MPSVELTGQALYKCNCGNAYDLMAMLKAHIVNCIQKPYECVHCGKERKSILGLLQHYREHGRKRFKCSLCLFRHWQQEAVRVHMKTLHNVSCAIVLPAVFSGRRADPDADDFVLRPRQTAKSINDISLKVTTVTTEQQSHSTTNNVVLKLTFGPDDISKLPRQPIYTQPVKCAMCDYETKVKTNMERHLQMHVTQNQVPESAPVNPVPCLDKNEKMFDKMVNLASSSHVGGRMGGNSSNNSIKIDEIKVPGFIPVANRFVCGAENCRYQCLDEGMLRRHILAFHGTDNMYKCIHCNTFLIEDKTINVDVVLKHMKLHDSHLYKCSVCPFTHNLKHKIERHLSDKHPDKPQNLIVVRELNTKDSNLDESTTMTESQKPFRCGICKFRCSELTEIKNHVEIKHNINSKYKCALCPVGSDDVEDFTNHFTVNHEGQTVDFIVSYYKEGEAKSKSNSKSNQNQSEDVFNTTPLWQRNNNSVKHIRGILLEETSSTTSNKRKLIKRKSDGNLDDIDANLDDIDDKKIIKRRKIRQSLNNKDDVEDGIVNNIISINDDDDLTPNHSHLKKRRKLTVVDINKLVESPLKGNFRKVSRDFEENLIPIMKSDETMEVDITDCNDNNDINDINVNNKINEGDKVETFTSATIKLIGNDFNDKTILIDDQQTEINDKNKFLMDDLEIIPLKENLETNLNKNINNMRKIDNVKDIVQTDVENDAFKQDNIKNKNIIENDDKSNVEIDQKKDLILKKSRNIRSEKTKPFSKLESVETIDLDKDENPKKVLKSTKAKKNQILNKNLKQNYVQRRIAETDETQSLIIDLESSPKTYSRSMKAKNNLNQLESGSLSQITPDQSQIISQDKLESQIQIENQSEDEIQARNKFQPQKQIQAQNQSKTDDVSSEIIDLDPPNKFFTRIKGIKKKRKQLNLQNRSKNEDDSQLFINTNSSSSSSNDIPIIDLDDEKPSSSNITSESNRLPSESNRISSDTNRLSSDINSISSDISRLPSDIDRAILDSTQSSSDTIRLLTDPNDLTVEDIEKMPHDQLIEGNLIGTYGPYGTPWDGKLKCPLCDKFMSKTEVEFKCHLYEELQCAPFKCAACDLCAPYKRDVLEHYQREHGEHQWTVSREKPGSGEEVLFQKIDEQIECWVRMTVAVQSRILMGEGEKLDTEDKFMCLFCNYKSDKTTLRWRHLCRHFIEKKPYTCNHCNFGALTQRSLKQHYRSCERCSNLGESVTTYDPSEGVLITHYLTNVKKLTLSSLDQSRTQVKCYYCDYSGTVDQQTEHSRREHPKEIPSVYRYRCNVCAEPFATIVTVSHHFFVKHPGIDVNISMLIDNEIKHVCDECKLNLGSEKKLIEHQAAQHPRCIFNCVYCAQRFTTWKKIVWHCELRHTKEAVIFRFMKPKILENLDGFLRNDDKKRRVKKINNANQSSKAIATIFERTRSRTRTSGNKKIHGTNVNVQANKEKENVGNSSSCSGGGNTSKAENDLLSEEVSKTTDNSSSCSSTSSSVLYIDDS